VSLHALCIPSMHVFFYFGTTTHRGAPGRAGIPHFVMSQTVILAGGCFWCIEAVFSRVRGVFSCRSGFAGGHVANPTYEQVCTGTTGHAEAVEIVFQPEVVSFSDLLTIFFDIIDPTTLNRQGNDVGTQYRSAIFYTTPQQEAIARSHIAQLEHQLGRHVVTEVLPAPTFYKAEVSMPRIVSPLYCFRHIMQNISTKIRTPAIADT